MNKQKIREEIWNLLVEKGLTSKITHPRIPRFKGEIEAAVLLRKTSEWNASEVIFSSPDSAQLKVREYALRDCKEIIMASPKLKNGYLCILPKDASGQESRASTIKGAFKIGKRLLKFPRVDLVVEGSVAVDLKGGRLGKGAGYADQEINHLLKEGAINEDTPIATTVHEAQIVSEVPMEPHDRRINMIVTPERVILV